MPFIQLKFKPGLNRDQTNYSNEGGWYECDKIRFRSGYPEKLGGWVKYTFETLVGTCRQMFTWFTTFGDDLMALGTNSKAFIDAGGNLFDVTPLRATTTAGDVTFAATAGSSILTVTDTANGAQAGDFVTFSGAVSLGGNITAAVLNQNYEVASVINANNYTIVAKDTSGNPVVAAVGDSGDGGVAVIGYYEIYSGNSGGVFGYGWGTSTWSRGAWGSGSSAPVDIGQTDWFFDNFDNDLVMNQRTNGKGAIYYWARGVLSDPSVALNTRAVLLSSLAGANEVPVLAGQILVSQNDKHLLAFGAVPYGSSSESDYDPLLIRWANQDEPTEWEPTPTNSAGFLRVSRGSVIVRAFPTRQEIVVFTDSGLYSLQFLGTTDVFGLQEIATNISIISPRAVASSNNVVFWMGRDKFYIYDGRVQTLATTLWTHVFRDLNYDQSQQIIAGTNEGFNEVWWFYPSQNSQTIDSYVIYNYVEQIWYYGSMARTAWLDSGLRAFPQAVGGEFIYNHESGVNDDALPMTSFIKSSDFDIGDGEQFMLSRRIIPDIKFNGSNTTQNATPTATLTLYPRRFPGSAEITEPPSSVIETTTDQYTNEVFIRARGRSMALKVGSEELGVNWQVGNVRLDARQDGKR
jgi:hypothetical protein